MFGKSKALVGLDIGSSSIKAIELSKSKSGYEIVGFARHTLGPDAVVDGAITDSGAVSEAIKAAFTMGGFKSKAVVTSVSGHSVIVKRVVLPVDSAEEVESSIQFGADEYIPFEITDVNLDYEVIGPSEGEDEGLDNGPTSSLWFTSAPNILHYTAGLSAGLLLDRNSTFVQKLHCIIYYRVGTQLFRAQTFNLDGTPDGHLISEGVQSFEVKLVFVDGDEADEAT